MNGYVVLLAGKPGTFIQMPNGVKMPISADPQKPTKIDWPDAIHAQRAAQYGHGVEIVKMVKPDPPASEVVTKPTGGKE